jgi:hypothetical protein
MRTVRETTKHGANLLFIPLMTGFGLSVILYFISPVSVLLIPVGLTIGLVLLFTHPFGVELVIDEDGEPQYAQLPLENSE